MRKDGARRPAAAMRRLQPALRAVALAAAVATLAHAEGPGWPIGSYQVEILVGGKSVSTKTFQVK